MAVKVIRYGSKRRVICGICGSLLEYESTDAKPVQTGMHDFSHEIVCPNCQEKILVRV